jgi:hypothetical protein
MNIVEFLGVLVFGLALNFPLILLGIFIYFNEKSKEA